MIESISSDISMPDKISGSSSWLHMTKVWENLKLAMQRCKVALPREDIDDPSAVLGVVLHLVLWLYSSLQSYCIHQCELRRELLQSHLEP